MSEKEPEKTSEDCFAAERLKFQLRQEVPQFGDKLLQRLDEFRKKNMCYDVTLKATDADLAAHKVVLALCGGMFRSHFIDPKTKKILGNVDEVSFSCPAAGLHPILKFAYSGALEITEENLFPTYLASTLTEMKEVQEICANLAMSRLAWVIDFDGSESTTPRLTSENKVTDQNSVAKIDLEEAFALLHHLLLLNSAVFSKTEARDQCENSEKDEDIKFACISEVERRWPKHSSTYKELVKCLIKIKASRSLVKENKTLKAANDDPQTATQATPASDNVISGYNQSAEAHTLESNEEKASEADECKITKAKLIEADAKTKVEMQQSSASPVDNQTVAGIATEAKPTTKPRTISIAQEPSKLIGNDSDMAPPTAHRRQRSLGAAQTQSAVTPRKPTTTVPSASGKPRKKHAAPKPPGPPPNSAGKNLTSKSGTKSANGAPASTTKVVPPRPKPPSVKAKKVNENTGALYDDALNPFADDDENDTVAEHGTDYDASLNPFG